MQHIVSVLGTIKPCHVLDNLCCLLGLSSTIICLLLCTLVCYYLKVGADAIGMSTVHEVLVARHSQIRVLGFSLITNISVLDYGDDVLHANHQEVLETGKVRSEDMKILVSNIVGKIE